MKRNNFFPKKGDDVKFIIKHNGAVKVNGGVVKENGKNIVALEFDLKSKYCDVGYSFGGSGEPCGVYIQANRRSLNLNKKVNRYEPTGIVFKDFVEWDVFSCNVGKYTMRVCLIRNTLK